MNYCIRLLVFGFPMMFVSLARAEVPFDFHAPYAYGVVALGGGSGTNHGSYFDEAPYHSGQSYYCIDLNAPDNSGYPVLAIADGVVVADRESGHAGYHTAFTHDVAIEHEGGYYSLYMHLRSNNVNYGDVVQGGQVIGVEGATGTGSSHLHFCIFDSSNNSIKPSPMDGTDLEDDLASLSYGHMYGYYVLSANDGIFLSADIEAALDAREAAAFSVLNPLSGNTDGNTPLNVLGTRDGNLDMWFGTDPDDITYDDGVPNDAYVQYYTGGSNEGAIIVHPDSGMAVELYGIPYKFWAGESTAYSQTDNCGVSWFLNGYGPHSEFGLPLTGKYYVPENDRWRVDFQRGYMSWDQNTQTMYFNCYTYATPGWTTFTNMGWDGSISAAVAQAYERNGAKPIVGYAFDDNDGGTTVHIWDGEVIQNFNGGEMGENAIIVNLDALSESLPLENTASVIRGGFWDYYGSNDGPAYFGSPLGDEMDTGEVNGELIGYDPVCDDNDDGENNLIERESCIIQYCGTGDYSSMQRFEEVTLCYDFWEMYVECDPNSDNWVCHYVGSSSVNHEGDLWVYDSTIYWVQDGETRGIVSTEAFEACGFDWADPYPVTEEVFSELPEGSVITSSFDCGAVEAGDLVHWNGTVYRITDTGLKRGFTSAEVFNACGYDWDQITYLSLDQYPVVTTLQDGSDISNVSDCGYLTGEQITYLTPDLIWRETSTGTLGFWLMSGSTLSSWVTLGSSDLGWSVEGAGDFTGDGSVDFLWRHLSSPYELYLWEMNGTTVVSSVLVAGSTSGDWVIRGIADFTLDGEPDILWKDSVSGALSLWEMVGSSYFSSITIASSSAAGWDIRALGDLTGDGKTDILWRNASTGELSLWEMDGTSYVSSILIASSSSTDWDVLALGDFTSDLQADLLWRNPTTGDMGVWEMDGTSYVSFVSMTASSSGWTVVAVGEVDGN